MASYTSHASNARPSERLLDVTIYIVLTLGAVVMLLPFAWMLSTSLKTPPEIFTYPITWIPTQLVWDNYRKAFEALPFGRFFFNSLFVSTTTTFLDVLTASLAAFAFARLQFRGRDQLFLIYLGTLMIPSQVTLIPSFVIVRLLGWYDQYPALILPMAFSAFSTFLLRQNLRAIPIDLDEAARIDGASSVRIWWSVALPLARPALAALATLSFLNQWNSFLWPLMVTRSMEMRTIPVGLSMFQGQYNTQWNLLMAGAVIALAPVLLVYVIGQKWIVSAVNLSSGGAK